MDSRGRYVHRVTTMFSTEIRLVAGVDRVHRPRPRAAQSLHKGILLFALMCEPAQLEETVLVIFENTEAHHPVVVGGTVTVRVHFL